MKTLIKVQIFLLVILFFSCNKEYNNPYDRASPSNIWTPTNLNAVNSENGTDITWDESETHFDGFVLQRSNDSATWASVKSGLIIKTIRNYTDSIISPGSKTFYRIYGKADLNVSGYAYSKGLKLTNLPTVITSAVSLVTFNSASSGGDISSNGGEDVTDRGVCWNTNHNPTILNNKISNGSGIGSFTDTISGLNSDTTFYIRAYATNIAGTAYGNEVIFRTLGNLPIGTNYGGGIIAYYFKPEDIGYVQNQMHGIIAAPNDLSSKLIWGPYIDPNISLQLFSGLSQSIGAGKQNTQLIVQVAINTGLTYSAVYACVNYTNSGFSDWFLPSENELIILRNNLAINSIGSFYMTLDPNMDPYSAQFGTGYWSSSLMQNGVGALAIFFSNGGECGCAKFESYWVRPIRYF